MATSLVNSLVAWVGRTGRRLRWAPPGRAAPRCLLAISGQLQAQQPRHFANAAAGAQSGRSESTADTSPAHASRRQAGPARRFIEYGFTPAIGAALDRLSLHVPTSVQQRALPRLLAGRSVSLTAPTGSGKTLAFLLPVLQRLESSNAALEFPLSGRPRALLLVPTRELGAQHLRLARQFSRAVRSMALLGANSYVAEARQLHNRLGDLVVATPGRLLLHAQRRNCALTRAEVLILDEASILTDSFFLQDVQRVVAACSGVRQLVLVSSTRTASVTNFLASAARKAAATAATAAASTPDKDNPKGSADAPPDAAPAQPAASSLESVIAPGSHVVPTAVNQEFLRLQRGTRRLDILASLLASTRGARKTVFCNSIQDCKRVAFEAASRGHRVLSVHSGIPNEARKSNFQEFSALPPSSGAVLVTTSLCAHGLDLGSDVQIVNFRLPLTVADYLHRAGRAGRAGAQGRVVNIVSRKEMTGVRRILSAAGRAGKQVTSGEGLSKSVRALMRAGDEYFSRTKMNKRRNKAALRAQLGLPRNFAALSKQGRRVLGELRRKWRARRELYRLRAKGKIGAHHLLPMKPKPSVEASTTDSFVQAKRLPSTGAIQLEEKRRSLRDPRTGHDAGTTVLRTKKQGIGGVDIHQTVARLAARDKEMHR